MRESEGSAREEVIEYLKKKIRWLEKRLQMYRTMLALLEGREADVGGEYEKISLISQGDEVIASLAKSGSNYRLIITSNIPVDSPEVQSFLVPQLNDLQRAGLIKSFSIREREDGQLAEIDVLGVRSEYAIKQVVSALQYVWVKTRQR